MKHFINSVELKYKIDGEMMKDEIVSIDPILYFTCSLVKDVSCFMNLDLVSTISIFVKLLNLARVIRI